MILLSPFFLLKIQVWFIIVFVYFSSFLISSNDQKDIPKSSILATCMLTVLLVYHIGSFFSSEKNLFPIDKVAQITSFDAGHENLYLIGMDELNYYFKAHKPQSIYYLGWPSLFVKGGKDQSISRVNRKVYEENRGYFESFQIKNSINRRHENSY